MSPEKGLTRAAVYPSPFKVTIYALRISVKDVFFMDVEMTEKTNIQRYRRQ